MSGAVKIVTAIIVIAIVAVVVSRKAKTVDLIDAFGKAFNAIVKTAVSPISGG